MLSSFILRGRRCRHVLLPLHRSSKTSLECKWQLANSRQGQAPWPNFSILEVWSSKPNWFEVFSWRLVACFEKKFGFFQKHPNRGTVRAAVETMWFQTPTVAEVKKLFLHVRIDKFFSHFYRNNWAHGILWAYRSGMGIHIWSGKGFCVFFLVMRNEIK